MAKYGFESVGLGIKSVQTPLASICLFFIIHFESTVAILGILLPSHLSKGKAAHKRVSKIFWLMIILICCKNLSP